MIIDIEKEKERYLRLIEQNIHREGIDKLVAWLKGSDFFTAPASTRFHLSQEGGLLKHSLNVYDRLLREYCMEYSCVIPTISQDMLESLTIMALFHDLCKVNYYKIEYKNVKENDTWVKKPCYVIDEKIKLGHSEKSIILLQSFIKLKMVEILAINSHMGFSDRRVLGGDYSITDEWEGKPQIMLLHIADLKATKIDEAE